jgi:hypothetical protein
VVGTIRIEKENKAKRTIDSSRKKLEKIELTGENKRK